MRLLLSFALFVASVLAEEMPRSGNSTTCPCGWSNKGRIVGGKAATKNAYPFIVSIVYVDGGEFCGGTIITRRHVLTASHCTYRQDPANVNIYTGVHVIGANMGTKYRASQLILHESFNIDHLVNDISIIVTDTRIRFNQNVGPACLPTGRLDMVGKKIKAIGWGKTSDEDMQISKKLMEVDLPVIDFDTCFETWKYSEKTKPHEETNMCTYADNKDTCQGDSGGPLVWLDPDTNRYTLVALVSYGGVCGGQQAAPNTDVGAFLPWINEKIRETQLGTHTCTKTLG